MEPTFHFYLFYSDKIQVYHQNEMVIDHQQQHHTIDHITKTENEKFLFEEK